PRGQHPAGHDATQPRPRAGPPQGDQLRRAGRARDRRGARMSAAHVRRGGGSGRSRPRKAAKVAVPKKIAKRLPVDQARANKVAGLVFGAFVLAIALVVLVALDIPAKAERAAGTAVGRAGFTVGGYQIVGINHMNRGLVDAVVTD